jgi:HlyD family secretion protein
VEVVKAQLTDARAAHDYEMTLLAHHTLLAPFDAVIVERLSELGTVIKPGDPIFTLVARETVWARAFIDESRAGYIEVGQPAEVHLRSLPRQTFKARVERIGIESDRVSEERRVYVKCEQCPPSFHLGEQAEVLITVAKLDKARLVPEIAVQGFDGAKGTVWIVENGRLKRRTLPFRHRTEDARLEVADGAADQIQIVSEIGSGFREGRPAHILAERGQ